MFALIQNVLKKTLRIVRKQKKAVAIVEFIDDHYEVVESIIDPKKRNITIRATHTISNKTSLKRTFFTFDEIIIALDSTRATTIESEVTIRRVKPKTSVTEAELENLLFKSLWEFLNKYRSWTAQKMNVSDLELVLMNVEIGNVRFDSSTVITPLGLEGKELKIRLRGTFVPRIVLDELSDLFSGRSIVSIVERGSILAGVFASEEGVVVTSTQTSSVSFLSKKKNLYYAGESKHGIIDILDAITERFSINRDNAQKLLEAYCRGKTSLRIERLIEKELQKAFVALLKTLKPLLFRKGERVRPQTHIDFHSVNIFRDRLVNKFNVRLVHIMNLLCERDYTIHSGIKFELSATALSLLGGLTAYPAHSEMTRMLHRRARWLIRTKSPYEEPALKL